MQLLFPAVRLRPRRAEDGPLSGTPLAPCRPPEWLAHDRELLQRLCPVHSGGDHCPRSRTALPRGDLSALYDSPRLGHRPPAAALSALHRIPAPAPYHHRKHCHRSHPSAGPFRERVPRAVCCHRGESGSSLYPGDPRLHGTEEGALPPAEDTEHPALRKKAGGGCECGKERIHYQRSRSVPRPDLRHSWLLPTHRLRDRGGEDKGLCGEGPGGRTAPPEGL